MTEIENFSNNLQVILNDQIDPSVGNGIAISVFNQNNTIITKELGNRDVEKGLEFNSDTSVPFGSVVKLITSHLCILFSKEEIFSLEDPINDYIPIEIGFKDDIIRI